MAKLSIKEEYYGDLLPYIKNDLITDITWNGRALWVDHLEKGRYKEELELEPEWVEMFSARLSDLSNTHFNYSKPLLEAETEELRISVLHPDVTNGEYSLAIRKTPAIARLSDMKMLEEDYASKEIVELLKVFVKTDCSIIVIGEVGAGKTELVKYLAGHVPNYQRTVTIEDNYELRLASVYPDLDVNEVKINEASFDYRTAIKANLRQKVHNMLLSEARGREMHELLEAASTGCRVITTLHCRDVRKLVDRVCNMLGEEGNNKENDVYTFFDVIIKVAADISEKGIHRSIEQIGLLDRTDDGHNMLRVLYDNGCINKEAVTGKFIKKFEKANFSL